MEEFQQHCTDIRPNITYLAIGSAYSESGGFQQHPPFLEDIMTIYPNYNIQIILVDPGIEDPPEVSQNFFAKKIDNNWYGLQNLTIHVIREAFDFNSFDPIYAKNETVSKKFLYSLINRTIAAKYEAPQNTYLFFVHDFSGNPIEELADTVTNIYEKFDINYFMAFKRNVLIDVNNKVGAGCFVDLDSTYFYPFLFKNSFGSLEIFNPFQLDNDEISTILLQTYNNPLIKKLVLHMITHRFNVFISDVLAKYRQLRLFLENKTMVFPTGVRNDEGLLTNISADVFGRSSPIDLIFKITQNLLFHLNAQFDFLNHLEFNNIFKPFIDVCHQPELNEPYKPQNIFRECQKKIENLLFSLDPTKFYVQVYKYTTCYTIKCNKLPLFLELLLQDKKYITEEKQTVNDTSVIITL